MSPCRMPAIDRADISFIIKSFPGLSLLRQFMRKGPETLDAGEEIVENLITEGFPT